MEFEDIQRHVDRIIREQNERSLSEFEGYSPEEMNRILYDTFRESSPIQLKEMSSAEYDKIPLLNQIKYLADIIEDARGLKLTKKGYLPIAVAELYDQGFMKDEHIEAGITKLYKETDSITVNLPKILLEISPIAKKRNGILSLTKKGVNIRNNNAELLKTIFEICATKFNWAYYDGYGENQIGQLGHGFTLILLSKYGDEQRSDSFYADKYFKAFPQLLYGIEPSYGTLESYSAGCYSIRTFDRFLQYFGLVQMEGKRMGLIKNKRIKKTELFDQLIHIKPPPST